MKTPIVANGIEWPGMARGDPSFGQAQTGSRRAPYRWLRQRRTATRWREGHPNRLGFLRYLDRLPSSTRRATSLSGGVAQRFEDNHGGLCRPESRKSIEVLVNLSPAGPQPCPLFPDGCSADNRVVVARDVGAGSELVAARSEVGLAGPSCGQQDVDAGRSRWPA
jgi:hypothetical protein